jgi:hypothetical protein
MVVSCLYALGGARSMADDDDDESVDDGEDGRDE